MITIKNHTYTPEEVRMLGLLFGEMELSLLTNFCPGVSCKVCKYRHICDAIHRANTYINSLDK